MLRVLNMNSRSRLTFVDVKLFCNTAIVCSWADTSSIVFGRLEMSVESLPEFMILLTTFQSTVAA